MTRVVLASASPRRLELLKQIGVKDIVVRPADVDESAFAGLDPETMVRELARAKARAVMGLFDSGTVVIGSDTAVTVDGETLGKPADAVDAGRMLRRLSGRTHSVLTGLCVAGDGREEVCCCRAEVRFRELREEEIERYIETKEPFDKAGAYGIQGRAAAFVKSVNGDYYSIVGLPLCRTSELLREFGVNLF